MAERKISSREKIVQSALKLFSVRGITATTTKEIAEKAGVNEVTLFRQFGSKQGLLLAVLQEAPILDEMQAALTDIVGANDPLMAYGAAGLELLGRVPELVRSLIGEAGQFPLENRQALGQALRQANLQTVGYLRSTQVTLSGLSIDAIASLLNTLIIGHAILEASSDGTGLWKSEEDFLAAVDSLFLQNEVAEADEPGGALAVRSAGDSVVDLVSDLPGESVRSLFQKAKKKGAQEYALVYVLFGAGLRLEECVGLMRSQVLASKAQHLLTITSTVPRQVPVNRWIMGNRYGTYLKNPLTQWIKSRQDECSAVFITESGEPTTESDLMALWESVASDTVTLTGNAARPFQARQTWCIELLMKGISLENLSILSGLSQDALAPYSKRAKEKTALEQALAIDQKNS
ncbi:MAG: TetR/AcrR family transcriptional regulator [Cyanobacteria bacterium J06631_9]